MEQHRTSLPTLIVTFSLPAEAEKAAEEKEKDKERREETATEATDAKDKTEAADVKKGTSHCLWWTVPVVNSTIFFFAVFLNNRRSQR